MSEQHRLSGVDPSAKTGVCSVDGPVKVYVTKYSAQCSVYAKAKAAEYRDTHRKSITPKHTITGVDEDAMTGICARCGPTDVYRNVSYKGSRYWRCATKSRTYALSRLAADPGVYERYRDQRFTRLYGITLAQYDQMVEDQQGLCARCQVSLESCPVRLAVDHNHETGEVRMLLCGPCNTYLGRLEAQRDQLERDLRYLDTGLYPALDRV